MHSFLSCWVPIYVSVFWTSTILNLVNSLVFDKFKYKVTLCLPFRPLNSCFVYIHDRGHAEFKNVYSCFRENLLSCLCSQCHLQVSIYVQPVLSSFSVDWIPPCKTDDFLFWLISYIRKVKENALITWTVTVTPALLIAVGGCYLLNSAVSTAGSFFGKYIGLL